MHRHFLSHDSVLFLSYLRSMWHVYRMFPELTAVMMLIQYPLLQPPVKDNRSGYESLTIPIAYVKYGDIVGMTQVGVTCTRWCLLNPAAACITIF